MHESVAESVTLLDRVQRMHRVLYAHFGKIETVAKSSDLSQGDRADLAYLMREIAALCDDCRKEAKTKRELLDRIICLVWTKQCEDDPDETSRSIKGEIATATPRIRLSFKPPHPRDPEYVTLLSYFGIDDHVIADGALRPHWPSMTAYLSKLMEEGKPLPPGIDPSDTYPIYATTLTKRTRKEV